MHEVVPKHNQCGYRGERRFNRGGKKKSGRSSGSFHPSFHAGDVTTDANWMRVFDDRAPESQSSTRRSHPLSGIGMLQLLGLSRPYISIVLWLVADS